MSGARGKGGQRADTDATLADLKAVAGSLNDVSGRLTVLLEILPNILDEGGTSGSGGRPDPRSAAAAGADRAAEGAVAEPEDRHASQ